MAGIDYVEVRNADRVLIGIIDTAQSVIWRSVYFGVGDFEVYTQATPDALALLRVGNYITRPNNREVGIIERLEIVNDNDSGKMVVASGRFAKAVLDRRLIYNLSGTVNTPTVLRGLVEEAMRKVVSDNAISCAFDSKRNISALELGVSAGIQYRIVDESGYATQKQASYQPLMEYTDSVLEEYGLAATVILNGNTRKLQYIVYEGADRSANNQYIVEPVVFSQQFDNLIAAEYTIDGTAEKNTALIGGEGEGIARHYALLTGGESDLQRREIWIDAGSISKAYKDEAGVEHTYTNAEYTAMLKEHGRVNMVEMITVENFGGTIDITNGNYTYGRDFSLGDWVTVQDNDIGKYVVARITEIVEVQDENGYTVSATYQA